MKAQLFIAYVLIAFPIVSARLFGLCPDEHGCHPCTGYTWCEQLDKCVRS